MNKKILIIGGGGYIGTRLCEEFDSKWDISCLDFFKYSNPINNNIKIFKEDYSDITKKFISNYDVIILLAGHSSVRMCDGLSCGIMQNNVFNFIRLLDMIDDQMFIYASSASVYGNCKIDSASENTQYDFPYNMYDMSKQTIDAYTLATKATDKRVFGLRFGTVNGYSKIFRNDVMLNAMASTAINSKKVNVFNPETRRSILGIKDLVRGIESIILSNKSSGGLYNMASFTKTSGEMGKSVSSYFGVPLNIIKVDEIQKNSLNEKLISSKYNFALDTNKFSQDFNFKFQETELSILSEIKNKWNDMIPNHRNEKFDYIKIL